MWGVWLLGATCFSFSAYAQNKVKAPMEDVNQVVDLTLDSLNKAKQPDRLRGLPVREIILYFSWLEIQRCVLVR